MAACATFVAEQERFRQALIAQHAGKNECTRLVLDSNFMRKQETPTAPTILEPRSSDTAQTEITLECLEELGTDFDIVQAFQSAREGA